MSFDFEKNAKRYYYQSLPSDVSVSFRVPKQLRDDFNKIPNKPSLSTLLKSFLIDYVTYYSDNEQSKDKKE